MRADAAANFAAPGPAKRHTQNNFKKSERLFVFVPQHRHRSVPLPIGDLHLYLCCVAQTLERTLCRIIQFLDENTFQVGEQTRQLSDHSTKYCCIIFQQQIVDALSRALKPEHSHNNRNNNNNDQQTCRAHRRSTGISWRSRWARSRSPIWRASAIFWANDSPRPDSTR